MKITVKRIAVIVFLFFISKNITAQLLFQKRYEIGSIGTGISSITKNSDTSYLTTGYFNIPSSGYGHVMCLDTTGSVLWEKDYSYARNKIVANTDGTYTLSGGNGFAFLRIDSMGNLLADGYFGTANYDAVNNVISTSDGGNLLMGHFDWDVSTGQSGPYYGGVAKINSSGNVQWIKRYGRNGSTAITDAIELPGEGYLLYGTTTDFSDTIDFYDSDIILLKTDTTGNIISGKMIQTPGIDLSYRFFQLNNSHYLFSFESGLTSPFNPTKLFLMETDSAFNPVWAKEYATSSGMEFFHSVKPTTDEGIIFTDGYIFFKLDSIGDLQWKKNVYSLFSQSYYDINETITNNFIAVGNVGVNTKQGFVVKIDKDGEAGCNENDNGQILIDTLSFSFLPITFFDSLIIFPVIIGATDTSFTSLVYTDCYTSVSINEFINTDNLLIFPNPFSDVININLNEMNSNKISLSLFNDMGQAIISLSNISYDKKITLNTQGLSSGLYILQIKNDKLVIIKKLLKL